MSTPSNCPECGATLGGDPRATCPECGAALDPRSDAWNPYAPPSTTLGGGSEEMAEVIATPPSMLGKFALAFRLLGSNLALFGGILLTVWLPANLVIESIQFGAAEGDQVGATIRLNNVLQGVFGPIAEGALIFALASRMLGQGVSYREAMAVGFRKWGSLFVANCVAGLLILLGLVALIVPGILLAVRYSLLDSVVVLEQGREPRARSTDLTRGRGWQILAARLLFFAIFIPASSAAGYALGQFEALDTFWVNVALDCVFDIARALSTIVLFLFYWEARQQEAMKPTDPDGGDLGVRGLNEG